MDDVLYGMIGFVVVLVLCFDWDWVEEDLQLLVVFVVGFKIGFVVSFFCCQ